GLGVFRVGDRRERYQGAGDLAAKADGEDEGVTLDVVRALVDAGSKVNAATQAGDTGLHLAAGMAANRLVELLVARGAGMGGKTRRGQTPLAVASSGRDARLSYFYAGAEERSATAALLRKLGATE